MAKNDEPVLCKWDDLPEIIQKFLKKGFPFFKEPKFLTKKWINHFISHLIIYTDLREALQAAIDQKNTTLEALNIGDLLALLKTAADQWTAAGEQWDIAAEQWDNAADQWDNAADAWESYIKDLTALIQQLDGEQSMARESLQSAFSELSGNLNSILTDQESYAWYDPSSLTRTITIRVTTPTDGYTAGSVGLQLGRDGTAIAVRTGYFGQTYTYEEPIYTDTGALYTYTVEVQASGRTEGYSYTLTGDMYSGFTITVDNIYDSSTITVTGYDDAISWTLTDAAQTVTFTGTASEDTPAEVALPQVWRGVTLSGWTVTAEAPTGYDIEISGTALTGWTITLAESEPETLYAFADDNTNSIYFYSTYGDPYQVGDQVEYNGEMVDVTRVFDIPVANVYTRGYNVFGYYTDTSTIEHIYTLPGTDTSSLQSTSGFFYNMRGLTDADLTEWNTSNVTNLSDTFDGCRALTSLDLSGWDTSSVTSLEYMFYDCQALANVDVAAWDTSNVTTMARCFYNCYALKSLDLSGWDTSNINTMANLFAQATTLITIYATDLFAVSDEMTTSLMFNMCYALVGGAGTVYSNAHINGAYAHIDGGEDNPGYFTLKE